MSKGFMIALGFIFAVSSASAQVIGVKTQPNNCEDNLHALNVVHQVAEGADLIIIIARLGTGETRRNINLRRLHNAQTYLASELYWKRDPKTVVVAEGERVNGYGRLEIYVRGVFWDAMLIKRNSDLLVGSCEPDDIRPKWVDAIFYPFLDEKSRKSKRKGER